MKTDDEAAAAVELSSARNEDEDEENSYYDESEDYDNNLCKCNTRESLRVLLPGADFTSLHYTD